jgi:alcohol dehydrogenase
MGMLTKLNPVPEIVFGRDVSGSLAAICEQRGISRLLVICDGTLRKAGVLDHVLTPLEDARLLISIVDEIQPDPPISLVDAYAEYARNYEVDGVIGIGGGSSLDVAKGVSLLMRNRGSIYAYAGVDRVPRRGIPLILVPTTAGTGSEVTNVAVYSDENHNKFGVVTRHNIADVAVLDPLLTVGLPPEQTALTGLDALSHALESYVGPYNSFLTELYSLQAIRYVAAYLVRAFRDGSDLKAREHMLRASMLAGLSFTNTQTGGAHACAMALGLGTQLPHGHAVTLMLPEVIRFNLPAASEKLALVAQILAPSNVDLPPEEAAQACPDAVKALAQTFGIQFGLSNYGVDSRHLTTIARAALKNERIWANNPRKPTLEDVESIISSSL